MRFKHIYLILRTSTHILKMIDIELSQIGIRKSIQFSFQTELMDFEERRS